MLACDLDSSYSFFLPLTAWLWKRVGYDAVCLLVGRERDWRADSAGEVALSVLGATGADTVFLGDFPGHRSSTVAQLSRCFVGALRDEASRYYLTSDVDMWPLRADWFHRDDGPLQLFNAGAYHHTRYPLCYVGMPLMMWREVTGVQEGNLSAQLLATLDEQLGRSVSSEQAWNFDEVWMGRQIRGWSGYPDDCQMVYREHPRLPDRIDRAAWPERVSIEGMVDAHLLRPGWGENWPRLRPLFRQLLPALDSFVDRYHDSFASRAGC